MTTGRSVSPARGSLVERYVLPPEEIEALSLLRVNEALGDDRRWTSEERQVVSRVVYAAGDPTLAPLVRFSPGAVASGIAALHKGSTVVADVRMVVAGLDRARAARLGCPVACRIDEPTVAETARALRVPRAVTAMRALATECPEAVFVIGNAPTALLALLDLVDAGATRPSLVVGMPVGFVAAAESKAELAIRDVPFITIEGTRGGSAVAAAATNALLRLACEAP
jgi:precorrin-8X/cobalt-precorrin-8 methylmutase